PGEKSLEVFTKALEDDDGLLRYTALRNMDRVDQDSRLRLIAPKLYDPVKAVRMEAALQLSMVPQRLIREDDRDTLQANLKEYRQAMLYNSDFAPQRYNLGNLENNLGAGEQAAEYYRQAIAIDDQFYPAKVNLAMYYNSIGKNDEAKSLLVEVLQQQPELYEVAYSLGLLLAEMNDFEGAATYLEMAADGMPGYSRVRYNQALSLLKLKRWQQGEEALLKALEADPANTEYFVTLANLYLSFKETAKARRLCESILLQIPDHGPARDLQRLLDTQNK
ncbi:MAG: tetratricopeptide repeat protein, partial [Desulforhopalus sp.]